MIGMANPEWWHYILLALLFGVYVWALAWGLFRLNGKIHFTAWVRGRKYLSLRCFIWGILAIPVLLLTAFVLFGLLILSLYMANF